MAPRSKNFLILGLIIGTFVVFALIGRFLIHPENMDKVNKGTLIVPHVQVGTLELETLEGQTWSADDMDGQWTLMFVAGQECARGCKNALYYLMKQLRTSLGKDDQRLRLMLIHTAEPSAATRTFIDEKLGQLTQVRGEKATVTQALAPAFPDSDTDPRNHLYLAAPDGQIFMWYPTHKDVEGVLKEADNIYRDLTRTLKGSLIG